MSKVPFEEFALKFAEELEIEGDDYLETPLDEIPEFDSMGKITASLVIESLFEFEIDYDGKVGLAHITFDGADDLASEVIENVEKLFGVTEESDDTDTVPSE